MRVFKVSAIIISIACVLYVAMITMSPARTGNASRSPAAYARTVKMMTRENQLYHLWKIEKDLPKAEKLCRQLIDMEYGRTPRVLELYQILGEEGKTAEAIDGFKKVLILPYKSDHDFFSDINVWLYYATLLDKVGEYAKASEIYREVLPCIEPYSDTDPRIIPLKNTTPEQLRALALVGRGMYPSRMESSKDTENWYTKAVRLRPELGIAQYYYGVSLQGDKKYTEAVVAYQKALADKNADPFVIDAARRQLNFLKQRTGFANGSTTDGSR